MIDGAREFVDAAAAAGIPRGRLQRPSDRESSAGVGSLFQITTRQGRRSSTYRAYLEGDVERRPNLELVCDALVTRVMLETLPGGELVAQGVEFHTDDAARPSCWPVRRWC